MLPQKEWGGNLIHSEAVDHGIRAICSAQGLGSLTYEDRSTDCRRFHLLLSCVHKDDETWYDIKSGLATFLTHSLP